MDTKSVKCAAFMTAPRYEATWARNQIEIALKQVGVPLTVSGGVFYGQCMQKMFEMAIENGCEVGITIDFDSVFNAEQLERLISLIVNNDHIDAITAMQCRRGQGTPLATIRGETYLRSDGSPFQVTTAHFGLTAIDMTKLANVPKPWFWSKPDENGEWENDKTDDDIWFWRQWEKAGHTIYMDPKTLIGHLEEMVTEFAVVDGEFRAVHTYPADWKERNGC